MGRQTSSRQPHRSAHLFFSFFVFLVVVLRLVPELPLLFHEGREARKATTEEEKKDEGRKETRDKGAKNGTRKATSRPANRLTEQATHCLNSHGKRRM